MDIQAAEKMIIETMREHGLHDWKFQWTKAVRQFGICKFGSKTIGVSRTLTLINSESEIRDTILHEVAHALAGFEAGHGPVWKRTVRSIGGNPKRTADGEMPEKTWTGLCPNCSSQVRRFRRTSAACSRCCTRYNSGRFAEEFRITWVRTDELDMMQKTV